MDDSSSLWGACGPGGCAPPVGTSSVRSPAAGGTSPVRAPAGDAPAGDVLPPGVTGVFPGPCRPAGRAPAGGTSPVRAPAGDAPAGDALLPGVTEVFPGPRRPARMALPSGEPHPLQGSQRGAAL